MGDDMNEKAEIISIRLIRSFEYRNVRNILMKDVDLNMKVEDFEMEIITKIKQDKSLNPTVKYYAYGIL